MGRVSSSGLYSAPNVQTVTADTVSATSVASPSTSAAIQVKVQPISTPSPAPVSTPSPAPVTTTSDGSAYYVSASGGSDSNDGLAPTVGGGHGPWATIGHADSALALGAGGTHIYVTGNFTLTSSVITGSSGTSSARIIWDGQGTTTMTWTTGSNAGTCWQVGSATSTGSYVTVQGFNFTGSCATGIALRGDSDNALNNSIHNLDGGGGSPSSSCPATGAIQQVATYDTNPGLGLTIGDIGGVISGNTINQIGTSPNPSCAEWHGIYQKFPHTTIENNVISNVTSGSGDAVRRFFLLYDREQQYLFLQRAG